MRDHTRSEIALACGLASVAGLVDAIGFIHLGGFFVSFMSGNSTRAGAQLAQGSVRGFVLAFGLVAAFLAGVVCASLVRRWIPRHKRLGVLAMVAGALALAVGMSDAGLWVALVPPLMAFAMGAENVVFERGGEVSIGLTYMTGTLVKLGQGLAGALAGGERLGWVRYFALWAALATGSVLGGLGYHALGLDALWLAVSAVVLAGVVQWRIASDG